MLHNIPAELQQLRQWVVAGDNKIPMNPRTGATASVTDPNSWGTFDEAVRCNWPHIGFVLTDNDPYTIIDLDAPRGPEDEARQTKILELFNSYTERSQSGQGYHIITKGKLPTGTRRDKVEVYSNARYMICTGNVIRNAPINDCQLLLDKLFAEMNPANTATQLNDYDETISDAEVCEMAMGAANADKFNALCQGKWEGEYPSQSEADFALLAILAFYTRSNEQVRRLFRYSNLGKREKATRDNRYIDTCLRKIRAKQPEPIDISKLDVTVPTPQSTPEAAQEFTLPPGLVGDIARYIEATAIRPVKEVALAGAITLVAGIVGRSYNISNMGLNQYVILLAPTGTGKEGAAEGINRLLAAVRPKVPMVDHFVGPAMFASGQALIKVLDEKPCFVSILGEFGLMLQQLCDPRANPAEVMLKRVLLDLYAKSGWTSVLRGSVYSDKEKNTKMVHAPCVTILGESTPETFYDGLEENHISEGLIPRFSIVEYSGKRPPRNPNPFAPPEDSLVQQLADLSAVALATMNNNTCSPIQMDAQSEQLMAAFDSKCDNIINSSSRELELQLWNRAHLKALKLAGLIAVGINPHSPIITSECVNYATHFIMQDIEKLTDRFAEGGVGDGSGRHELEIRHAMEAYLSMSKLKRNRYSVPVKVIDKPIVPYNFLRRRLRKLKAFNKDKRGDTRAIKETLNDLVEREVIVQLSTEQAFNEFNTRSPLFIIGPAW